MPVNFYYTQKVRGFQQEKVKYSKESVEIRLKRTKHQCPYCGSSAVTAEPIRSCRIRGEHLDVVAKWYWNSPFTGCIATVAITVKWNIFHFFPTPKPG